MNPLRAWEPEDETFDEVQPELPFELSFCGPALLTQRPYWRSFFVSVFLHGACIFGLPVLMDLLPMSDAEVWQRKMLAMRALEIQIPDRLYFAPTAPDPAKQPPPRPKPDEPPPAAPAKAQLPPPPKPAAGTQRAALKQFRPPEGVRRTDHDLTLLQSHLPPDLPLTAQVKLPQLALLSGPVLPRPAPRRFVEPGKSAEPGVVPRVDAPPMLAAASDANPDLLINSMLAGPDKALLRLPRPNVPARKFQAPAPLPSGRGASLSPTLGEPVNLLALSSDPAALQERVTIPLGNQIGRLPAPLGYEDAQGADAASKGGGTASKGTGSGPGGAKGTGQAGSNAAGSSGPGAALGRQSEMEDFLKALAGLPERYATPIKIEHLSNAVFDVVVMQSSAEQAFPDSAGALSGKPVYTVYLQVGAPKAWILQYCVPKQVAPEPQVSGNVVNIGNPSPLKAPYPLLTVLPPVTMLARTGYIIVHASLDTQGKLIDVEVLRAPNIRMKDLILPELAKWQFRPAVRDGAPVAVEILLAIPPQDV